MWNMQQVIWNIKAQLKLKKLITSSCKSFFPWSHHYTYYRYIYLAFKPLLYITCVLESLVAFMCRCVLILIVVCNSSELLNNILFWAKLNNLTFIFLIKYIYFDSFDQNYHCFFYLDNFFIQSWQFMFLVWISVFKFHIILS